MFSVTPTFDLSKIIQHKYIQFVFLPKGLTLEVRKNLEIENGLNLYFLLNLLSYESFLYKMVKAI